MIWATFVYGVLITSLGIIGYLATGQVSKTALIPCAFGLPIIALGIISWWRSSLIKQTSIAAVTIALLALGGTIRGIVGLITLVTGGEVARPTATIVQAIMAIASISYILYSLGSGFGKRHRNSN